MDNGGHPVLLFDGICNLCNASVQFVIRHDRKSIFHFSPLQSDFGQRILAGNKLPKNHFNSFLLLENNKLYQRSTAALRVARKLSFPYNLLFGLIIIPKPLRDWGYNVMARNRYKWFGKQESCMIPTPELKARFLD